MSSKAEAHTGVEHVSVPQPISTLRFILSGGVLKRNILIALIVGSVLSIANQFDVILRDPMSPRLGMKIFMNYVIPFIVSSVSTAVNRPSR